jgi:hypothetical protein
MTINNFETKMIFANSRFSSGAFLCSGFHCKHNFLFFWSLGVAHMPMWVRAMLDLSQFIFSTGGELRIDTLMPKWQKHKQRLQGHGLEMKA